MKAKSALIHGDAREVIATFGPASISACITDPPYNYEFIGHKWDASEIERRIRRVSKPNSKTLVKNIPYGSHLAGGVRDKRWYDRVYSNIIDYQNWCYEWAMVFILFGVDLSCKGGHILFRNSRNRFLKISFIRHCEGVPLQEFAMRWQGGEYLRD
jgi:hypothetical protein